MTFPDGPPSLWPGHHQHLGARYDGQGVARELGPGLALLKTVPEVHVTPRGARQSFQYSVFTRTQEALP